MDFTDRLRAIDSTTISPYNGMCFLDEWKGQEKETSFKLGALNPSARLGVEHSTTTINQWSRTGSRRILSRVPGIGGDLFIFYRSTNLAFSADMVLSLTNSQQWYILGFVSRKSICYFIMKLKRACWPFRLHTVHVYSDSHVEFVAKERYHGPVVKHFRKTQLLPN